MKTTKKCIEKPLFNNMSCLESKKIKALDKNTHVDVLIDLSKDKEYKVRLNVAKNINTPIEILKELSKDDNWVVRLAVVFQTNTPYNILYDLSKDNDTEVSLYAKDKLKNICIEKNADF